LLFEFSSAELTASGMDKLRKVANYINNTRDIEISVEGHTDSIDSEEFNLELSRQRAQAVADWFVRETSMEADRLNVVGYGESRPIVTSDAEDVELRKQEERLNRRVEIRVQAVK
jgi:OOP family OmpA-OmpF porin